MRAPRTDAATDARASGARRAHGRAGARGGGAAHLLEYYSLGRELVADTRIGFGSDPRGKAGDDTRYTRANGRVFARSRESYDFWVDNNLALIGSPETVARKVEESKERIGFTVFAASHHIGAMPVETVDSSIRLFGEEVIPAFERPAGPVVPQSRAAERASKAVAAPGSGPWGA